MVKKSFVAASVTVALAVAVCLVVAYVFSSQIVDLQAEVKELKHQNGELQAQNVTAQEQIAELQLQNKEKLDRLSDYTGQLTNERGLKAEITDAYCSRGWSPLGGLTGSYPANATIVNHETVPVYGLMVSFHFVNKNSGALFGYDSDIKVDHIDAGESYVVDGAALAIIDSDVDNLACRVTLSKGSSVLDTWIQQLG